MENNFLGLVRSVWSTYARGSSVYKLFRKTNILKQEIGKCKSNKDNDRIPSSWEMIQGLNNMQRKLMSSSPNNDLWL